MTILGEPTALFEQGLDNFELIGRSQSSTVYRATDVNLGRTVAVKVLHAISLGEADGAGPPEAVAQSKVSWHSNVLSLYESTVTSDGSAVLILEYAPGGSLEDRIGARGPLSDQELFELGAQLSSALAAAHEEGVLHCDLKPSNVLFAADGSARLADFGIARQASLSVDTLDPVQASLQFAPPELLEGARPTSANDVYGLALTLCYAASGELPFGGPELGPGTTVARVHAGKMAPRVLDAVPEELRGLIRRSLSPNPRDRPSAEDIRKRCCEAIRGAGGPPSTPVTRNHNPRRPLLPVLLVVAALLAGVVVAARTERPIEKPVVTPDLCTEFSRYVDARRDLIVRASEDLEQATTPTTVIERLLVTYPIEFSQIVSPFIETVIAAGGTRGDVTDAQLAEIGTAENLRALGNGRPFIFDGETGAYDPAAVPKDLWQSAEMFSEANRFAAERCPSVSGDVSAGKARLASAVYSSLANPQFMEQFYSDPASLTLIDPATALIMATMAWGFFEAILVGHYDWFLALLEKNDELRIALAVEYPEVFLTAAASAPELAPQFLRPEWRPDLVKGITYTSPTSRVGMYTQFPDQMAILGV
jgi:serine/threonine protein kinase